MKRFTCDELVEHLTAYLDDALDLPDREGVRGHLARCEGCGRYFEQFQATIVALRDPLPGKLPADVRSRLMAAFRERRRS